MAKPELGSKHQCQQCGTKFFDLNRDPIVCPKCGTVFQALTTRTGPRSGPVAAREDTDTEADTAGAELVSLEDVEAGEKVEVVAEDEIEIEDPVADDTFLEEGEEGADDVSGLIDGEIEDDEEV